MASPEEGEGDEDEVPSLYGDNAYGTGDFQSRLEDAGLDSKCKTQKPNATNGLFGRERFVVDLKADTVTCPAGVTVSIRRHADGGGIAKFADASPRARCIASAPLRRRVAGSSSVRTRRCSPGPASRTPAGLPTTGRPDPRWSELCAQLCAKWVLE